MASVDARFLYLEEAHEILDSVKGKPLTLADGKDFRSSWPL